MERLTNNEHIRRISSISIKPTSSKKSSAKIIWLRGNPVLSGTLASKLRPHRSQLQRPTATNGMEPFEEKAQVCDFIMVVLVTMFKS